ncbi:hypothetical protein WJ0W_005500 [Paenibacillus melissococcoides]|uniref:HK97 family phage prohead protease n=1 Tax=Paenibacillus melissococcoides TaxID=2912268 RepID=A0ABM9G8I7_9BACL|nr:MULTISPECIES: hypothetical protein [Paenibacillus]MEB9892443.1 hypothetical protein [Bacillus cereus]CAH8248243.1 hypothetical protein WJ0W_005500 [Paenibacillus melissococcoides]CAH8718065.1 hypothetical protein HTL2_005151 [Paenibacillus melissococcoides]CAH8719057.1 hypothetical protein WDD9_005422 [Paenibacillus melissococcoides]GIO78675.1 hypothetical protein J6TS7_22850 [Paenibacillus dendritiformis]
MARCGVLSRGDIRAERSVVALKNPGTTQLTITNYFQEDQWIEDEVREPAKGDAVSSWALPGYQKAKSNGLIPLNYDHAYQSPITGAILPG